MTAQNAEGASEMEYDVYLAFRAKVDDVRVEQLKSFDSAILNLASGALGLSLVLLGYYGAKPLENVYLLVWSWALLVASITINVVSYYAGSMAAESLIRHLDACIANGTSAPQTSNAWNACTKYANLASGLLFAAGAALLLAFAYRNTTGV